LVAHYDIKPDNFVYLSKIGLQIIDFDVVVKLNKNTGIVNNIVSTEGYMALELDNNQELSYSPLKTNLWSYG